MVWSFVGVVGQDLTENRELHDFHVYGKAGAAIAISAKEG